MAKKDKAEVAANEELKQQAEQPSENEAEKVAAGVADIEARIKALEAENAALKKKADEAGFDRVARALGHDPAEIRALEKSKADNEELMEYDIGPTVVHINGLPYSGKGEAPRGMAEMIVSMASARRQRLLKEQIGHEYILKELSHGVYTAKVVKRLNDIGEQI